MITQPFLVRPLPLGTVTTGNERSEKPAIHLGEVDAIGMTWQSNGNSNLWVRGDFGSAMPVDFVSLIHANAQSGTTIRLRLGDSQAEVDGTADYDSGALPFIDPAITRTDGLYSSHLELPSLQTKRWWRIDIGSHSGDFDAATLVMGRKIGTARFYSPDFQFGVRDLGSLEISRWGIPDKQDGLTFRTLKFKLAWITDTEFETLIRPLSEIIGRRNVLFACFDPTATAYRQAKSYLGWLRDDPLATGGESMPGTYSQDFSLLSMI